MNELIITNGDSAAGVMRAAGFDADILPWRDVLHEGPVPETPGLESLSVIRAGFLAKAFDLEKDDVIADIERRDRMLRDVDRYDQITLWFEHDLYDQLQLLQLLDFFHQEAGCASVHLVQTDDYLGLQSPESMVRFAALRVPVSAEQKALAGDLFEAFRKSTPVELFGFLDRDLAPLPHMNDALRRLFEDLPDSENGLSRTQRQVLTSIEREACPWKPKHLFAAVQAMEEAIFMGDWSFWRCLEEMIFNTSPLVDGLPDRFSVMETPEGRRRYFHADLTLTKAGRAVLASEMDHAEINTLDRWLGGTHITHGTAWRWDRNAGVLVSPA
ncbi:MAG: DUF1835 domain-containing protein [Geminicoccaceae bacterium]